MNSILVGNTLRKGFSGLEVGVGKEREDRMYLERKT